MYAAIKPADKKGASGKAYALASGVSNPFSLRIPLIAR
jgi:hypothetical protein